MGKRQAHTHAEITPLSVKKGGEGGACGGSKGWQAVGVVCGV